MQTTRIISNISYNTPQYFQDIINDLVGRGIIDWCYSIVHQADEDDEKQHIHFVLKPSKRLDTSQLRNQFNELDENHSLPLTCTMRWFPVSSMDDWLLYAIHHQAYLNSKGQYRRHHYEWKDVMSTDHQALKNDIANIDLRKYLILQWLEDAVRSNIPFFQLVQDGLVPISQRSQYEYQYKALQTAIKQVPAHPRPKLEYVQDELPNPFEE